MSQEERAQAVREMFSRIAPNYDRLNHLLSFGTDRSWREAAVRAALAHHPQRILDLATGTGDLALLLKRRAPEAMVTGADFTPAMLALARQKAQAQGLEVEWTEADALHLPFADASFDVVTTAFGFRNFADYRQALREIHRVLRPGGRFCLLELSPPPSGPFGFVYRAYFHKLLPLLGGLLARNLEAYRYLPTSVDRFPPPPQLKELMEQEGFRTHYQLLSWGIAALHIGEV